MDDFKGQLFISRLTIFVLRMLSFLHPIQHFGDFNHRKIQIYQMSWFWRSSATSIRCRSGMSVLSSVGIGWCSIPSAATRYRSVSQVALMYSLTLYLSLSLSLSIYLSIIVFIISPTFTSLHIDFVSFIYPHHSIEQSKKQIHVMKTKY